MFAKFRFVVQPLASSFAGGGWIRPASSRFIGYVPAKRFTTISEERLKEFLQAEVSLFADRQSNAVTLKEIIEATEPKPLAKFACAELPVRYAQRILQIEELPHWQESQQLLEVHELYFKSFRDVRMLDLQKPHGLAECTDVVKQIKTRMKRVIPLLTTAMRNLQHAHGYPEERINEWMDAFLLSRIGTEMLTSQYLLLVDEPSAIRGPVCKGIVDNDCDPMDICEQAARHAKRLCRQHFDANCDVKIVIEGHGEVGNGLRRVRFPYVPQYLFYVMVELLKNSARATVEIAGQDQGRLYSRPITVTVGANPVQVGIRVEDLAGGIPFSASERVWSYMYTTAKNGGVDFTQQGTPLAGYGVGLPLSRLYARYLGGSLQLMSMPAHGTSAYLTLHKLEGEARESLPLRSSIADP